jgi:hypothetical protein
VKFVAKEGYDETKSLADILIELIYSEYCKNIGEKA